MVFSSAWMKSWGTHPMTTGRGAGKSTDIHKIKGQLVSVMTALRNLWTLTCPYTYSHTCSTPAALWGWYEKPRGPTIFLADKYLRAQTASVTLTTLYLGKTWLTNDPSNAFCDEILVTAYSSLERCKLKKTRETCEKSLTRQSRSITEDLQFLPPDSVLPKSSRIKW